MAGRSHTRVSAEMLRLMDATPIPCGQSAVTAKRSDLYGWAGYGYCPSHSRWYWGATPNHAHREIHWRAPGYRHGVSHSRIFDGCDAFAVTARTEPR